MLYDFSKDRDLIKNNQLSRILRSDTTEKTITSGAPLKLEEGYELAIAPLDIEGDKAYVKLSKEDKVVDSAVVISHYLTDKDAINGSVSVLSRVVQPPADVSDTYTYSVRAEDSKEREILSVHFKGSMRGADQNLIIIDHVLQFSENRTFLGPSPEAMMDNHLLTIITTNFPLKLEEGYELAVGALDISGNRVFLELTRDGNMVDSGIIAPKNDGPDSYTYALDMGAGEEMEILSVHFKNAFHGPAEDVATADRIWQVSASRPSHVLIDEDGKWMLDSAVPLQLEEGYVLAIKAVDLEGGRAYFELYKDGNLVDSALVVPPPAKVADETYAYRRDLGETKGIVVIAAHFKNAFRGADQNLASIDGIWQISDTPTEIV